MKCLFLLFCICQQFLNIHSAPGNSKHSITLKIHVPEIHKHHIHTKTIIKHIYHPMHMSKPKPKPVWKPIIPKFMPKPMMKPKPMTKGADKGHHYNFSYNSSVSYHQPIIKVEKTNPVSILKEYQNKYGYKLSNLMVKDSLKKNEGDNKMNHEHNFNTENIFKHNYSPEEMNNNNKDNMQHYPYVNDFKPSLSDDGGPEKYRTISYEVNEDIDNNKKDFDKFVSDNYKDMKDEKLKSDVTKSENYENEDRYAKFLSYYPESESYNYYHGF